MMWRQDFIYLNLRFVDKVFNRLITKVSQEALDPPITIEIN